MNLVGFEWQPHQRDTDLVMHTGIDNRFSGIDQVPDIVHIIEIAVLGGTIFLHQLGLQFQSFDRLSGQGDSGYGAGEDLKVDSGPTASRIFFIFSKGSSPR